MKVHTIKLTHKKQAREFDVAVPETLNEAVKILGPEAVFQDFLSGYMLRSKREGLGIKKRAKRFIRVELEKLPEAIRRELLQIK